MINIVDLLVISIILTISMFLFDRCVLKIKDYRLWKLPFMTMETWGLLIAVCYIFKINQ